MRKSREVRLTLLAAVAVAVTGCRQNRNCVDPQGHLEPDGYCQASDSSRLGYHYVYGGWSGGRLGDSVVGASSTPRGGFGSIDGSSDGGGHGGGE